MMGFIQAAQAAMGIKTKNNNSTGTAGLNSILGMGGSGLGAIAAGIGGNSSKPVATDHTHDSDSKNQATTDFGPRGGDSRFDLDDKNDGFMGKNKDISGMQFGEMNRGGSMVDNSPVQTAGAFGPLGTPDFTPKEDFDQYGKQFIS